jgi:hypothetical protein
MTTSNRDSSEGSDHIGVEARIRKGLDQAKKGLGRPVDEVFDDLEREPDDTWQFEA